MDNLTEKARQFVEIWQEADSAIEAAALFGITEASARNKATRLRQRGVALKSFERGGRREGAGRKRSVFKFDRRVLVWINAHRPNGGWPTSETLSVAVHEGGVILSSEATGTEIVIANR